MDKYIGILDKDYVSWVKELVKRYRGSQIKAAIKVNNELLRYYWELGKDIEEKQADNKYGSKFYATLSRDLRHEMPDVEGLSETSIRYAKRFYTLYSQQITILPQLVEELQSVGYKGYKIVLHIVSMFLKAPLHPAFHGANHG